MSIMPQPRIRLRDSYIYLYQSCENDETLQKAEPIITFSNVRLSWIFVCLARYESRKKLQFFFYLLPFPPIVFGFYQIFADVCLSV